MAKPKSKASNTVKSMSKILSFTSVFKPEDENYTILAGDHPELVGQFVRTDPSKNAETPMCSSDVKEIGPNRVAYSHRLKWVDSRGEVRGGC